MLINESELWCKKHRNLLQGIEKKCIFISIPTVIGQEVYFPRASSSLTVSRVEVVY